MINPTSSSQSVNDIHTIDTKIQGGLITGQVKRLAGVWGDLNLKFISHESNSSDESDSDAYYERLRTQYKAISGIYTGIVIPPAQIEAPFSIQVRLFTVEINTPTGSHPQLQGFYHLDQDTSSDLDIELGITYKPELSPAEIVMAGRFSNSYSVNLEGYFVGPNKIQASLLRKGIRSQVLLKK